LRVRDLQSRQGVPHLRILGKGSKVRYVPAHPLALERIHDYLQAAGHGGDAEGPLFRPLKNPAGQGGTNRPLTHGAVYHRVLRKHATAAGIDGKSFGPHALRATAATNALDRGADLGKVQEWLGHANVSTTRLYDRRRSRPGIAPPSGWRIECSRVRRGFLPF
jgi:integrase/recombinase XerD